MSTDLSGKHRKLTSFIEPFQQRVVDEWVPKVPKYLETYHLTLMTIPISVGVIIIGYLSRQSIYWLPFISLFIFLQYLTDILDGAVGRYRKTGLVLWGFYMDHFCDYIFTNALFAAYTIAFRMPVEFFILTALVASGFFVHEFLMCVANGKLNTSGYNGFGPTEIRVSLIIITLFLPFIPPKLSIILMYILLPIAVIIFGYLVFRGQKILWRLDMEKKAKSKRKKVK